MIDPVDRWEPWDVDLVRCGGPERIYDDSPEPETERGPFGFIPASRYRPRTAEQPEGGSQCHHNIPGPSDLESDGPLLWMGDQA